MTVLHVQDQGASVRRNGERIAVTVVDADSGKRQTRSETPVRELEQVAIYGNVQLTTPAAALLLEHDVDIVFLSSYGKFRGRLAPSGSKHARLRHAQLRLTGDERKALAVATRIVQAKLANQRNTLVRLSEQPGVQAQAVLTRAGQGIEQMRRQCTRATTLDALRGYEGRAGASYFGAIRALLHAGWKFGGRKYHPAPDPFNALLSFGYALLLKDCSAAIQIVGLDPYLGCFHELDYGKPSLTLDLMEEFRPLAVDRPFLQMALSGAIDPNDFVYTKEPSRPVEIGDVLMPQVIEAYEQALKQTVAYGAEERRETVRRCLELQARVFGRVAMEQRTDYAGLVA
ncbi:MAG: CRISPR-associated endonuclease Cas1 [Caldilineaceae bacterium]